MSAVTLIFFEWLFFITKPSFFNLYQNSEKFFAFAVLATVAVAVALVVMITLALPAMLVRPGTSKLRFFTKLPLLCPLLLFTATVLLLIDNFTYTLFGYGVQNSDRFAVQFYSAVILLVAVLTAIFLGKWSRQQELTLPSRIMFGACVVLLIIGTGKTLGNQWTGSDKTVYVNTGLTEFPNVLILSGDGISAEHMSVYGYDRATTSFLEEIKSETLFSQNSFSNSATTGGAVISMLTGKLPTATRVIYPPDALHGIDAYQHLPGILKSHGYRTTDISLRHYADAYDLNLRGGFDESNSRSISDGGDGFLSRITNHTNEDTAELLMRRIQARISERFQHIFMGVPITDHFALISDRKTRGQRDHKKIASFKSATEHSEQPFFIHVHLMGTHGSRFSPRERVFSDESSRKEYWNIDGYDDAVLDFDQYVREVFEILSDTGKLESTLIIISSDHGYRHTNQQRVPLLMRFPDKSHAGEISHNTQRLDIAPTILDFLGLPQPEWMTGHSLINAGGTDMNYPIFTVSAPGSKLKVQGKVRVGVDLRPPFFSLARLTLIECNMAFTLHLVQDKIRSAEIAGSTSQCNHKPSEEAAYSRLVSHLQEMDYDVGSLNRVGH